MALACAIILAIQLPLWAHDVNVPLDHWVYPFLERMETLGVIHDPAMRAYPLTRQKVAHLLISADKQRSSLSRVDQRRLDQFRGEFYIEIERSGQSTPARYLERHLITWQQDEHEAFFDVDFRQSFNVTRSDVDSLDERTSGTRLGGIVRGQLGQQLGFYMHAHNTLHRGTAKYDVHFNPAMGTPIGVAGNNAYSDDATAYITFSNTWLFLEFGRDQLKWGPGYRGSLAISRENPQFELLKLQLSFNRWNYTAFHGWLHSSHAKYLAGHRLTWAVQPWLCVSGYETLIYSNRNIEPLYINPVMPFHVAEHHLGDKDNNTMGIDITLLPMKRHKFYFELFLDDFNTSQNPFRHYGNKFAIQLGHQWVNPFNLANTELRWEYTRIEPFVYTHKDSTLRYQNYDQSIGHWLGPDADNLFAQVEHSFHRDVSATASAERIRHGKGNINRPHLYGESPRKEFLEGIVETEWRYSFELTDQVIRDVFIKLRYIYGKISNLNRIENSSATNHRADIRLMVNW